MEKTGELSTFDIGVVAGLPIDFGKHEAHVMAVVLWADIMSLLFPAHAFNDTIMYWCILNQKHPENRR